MYCQVSRNPPDAPLDGTTYDGESGLDRSDTDTSNELGNKPMPPHGADRLDDGSLLVSTDSTCDEFHLPR